MQQQLVSLDDVLEQYQHIRKQTEKLCEKLEPEDLVVQSMPDVSPAKWHLAHTTWFFETFLLKPFLPEYRSPNPNYEYLFNSYYNAVGKQYPRAQRGLITRPTATQIMAYRHGVDEQIEHLLCDGVEDEHILERMVLGLNHEQQHQELMLMDIKHIFFQNPLFPIYSQPTRRSDESVSALLWQSFDQELCLIGADSEGFNFDNERPRHKVQMQPFALANRLITNAEYREFIDDGGYQTPELWLSDGWAEAQKNNWQAPLYWVQRGGSWNEFTLNGLQTPQASTPVSHISYYEADAFASWAGYRLPTEAEWELASSNATHPGGLMESASYHPQPSTGPSAQLSQMFGDLWEWTCSPYQAYPGFKPAPGALGEYNGKFMCSQWVLKGGCCATPQSHIRATYRNFYYPHQRWMFSGIRLAK